MITVITGVTLAGRIVASFYVDAEYLGTLTLHDTDRTIAEDRLALLRDGAVRVIDLIAESDTNAIADVHVL